MKRFPRSHALLLAVLSTACDDASHTARDASDESAHSSDASDEIDAASETGASGSMDTGTNEAGEAATPDAPANQSDGQVDASVYDAGSASDPAPVPLARPFRSGSRLKARYHKHAGAPDVFADMLDTKTGQPCRYVETTGGGLHCLPDLSQRRGLVQVGYLDAECKQPIYKVVDGCTTHDSMIARTSGCRNETSLYALEPVGSAVPSYRISASFPLCKPAGVTELSWLREGRAVTLDGFVAGIKQLVTSPTGLTREVIVGSDGSVDAGEIVTKVQRLTCRPDFTPELASCHLSTETSYDGPLTVYTDDKCSNEVKRDYAISAMAPECPAPEYLLDNARVKVDGNYGARRVGMRVSEVLYTNSRPCQLITAEFFSRSLFELGEVVPLPKLQGALTGSGRLQARLFKDEAGNLLGSGGRDDPPYWDPQANRVCELAGLPGGRYCLPEPIVLTKEAFVVYGDANCTTPLTECDDCARKLFVNTGRSSACADTQYVEAWRPGAAYTGVRYSRDGAGTCAPDPNDPALTKAWMRVPVVLDTLPKVELLEEPPAK